MPSIEDFVQKLYEGESHVKVPKEKVTELSPGWYVSKYNLPHRGSKGSLRNGRLHAHDMGDHYDVHLDTVDPKASGFGHLVKDAPLMFFFWTGISDSRLSVAEAKTAEGATEQGSLWWGTRLLVGLALLLVGAIVAINPMVATGLLVVGSIVGLLFVGALSIWKGISRKRGRGGVVDLAVGIISICVALLIYLEPDLVLALLFLGLTAWTLGSAFFLIFGQGDKLLMPRGSLLPLLLGFLSLVLAAYLILNPTEGISLIIALAGLLCAFIGVMQIATAMILWRAKKGTRAST